MTFKRPSVVLALVLCLTAVAVGSGAFTAVAAERTATIGVAGDDGALLAITPHADASVDGVTSALNTPC